jgi:hypothetical protein
VTCLNASLIYQAEVQNNNNIDRLPDMRSGFMMCVNNLTEMHELFDDTTDAIRSSHTMLQARCLYSMHTHFLDMQRSPPRKRPLLYPIHVCTCNNARAPSTPWTKLCRRRIRLSFLWQRRISEHGIHNACKRDCAQLGGYNR